LKKIKKKLQVSSLLNLLHAMTTQLTIENVRPSEAQAPAQARVRYLKQFKKMKMKKLSSIFVFWFSPLHYEQKPTVGARKICLAD